MAFKQPGGPLPPLHKPAIRPYLQQELSISRITTHLPQVHFKLSSHLRLGLPKGLFPSGFPSKILYAFLNCSTRASPAHLSRLYLRFLVMLGEEYNACSSALCNFLHSPAISSLLAPNIFLSTLFTNNLNPCSSQCERPSYTTIQYDR